MAVSGHKLSWIKSTYLNPILDRRVQLLRRPNAPLDARPFQWHKAELVELLQALDGEV